MAEHINRIPANPDKHVLRNAKRQFEAMKKGFPIEKPTDSIHVMADIINKLLDRVEVLEKALAESKKQNTLQQN